MYLPLPPYVIPVKRNNKSHHEKGYIQMYAKNDPYKNSFIPRFLRMTQQSTVGRFITDVRCTEHNANLEIGNGTKWRV